MQSWTIATPSTEMPTSRESGDFVTRINASYPPRTNNHTLHAISPLNPSFPSKAHPISFKLWFLENPRCRNALRNGETSLKNWNCFNLESLRSGTRSLKYKKVQSGFYPGDLVTLTGDWEIPGNQTSIKCPPLLRGRGHLLAVPMRVLPLFAHLIKRPPRV